MHFSSVGSPRTHNIHIHETIRERTLTVSQDAGVSSAAAYWSDRWEGCGRNDAVHESDPVECPQICDRASAPTLLGLLTRLLEALSGRRCEQPMPAAPAATKSAKPDTYPIVPEVGGSPSDWQRVHGAVADRLDGSDANKRAIHMDGANPWTDDGKKLERVAVWWALQSDPNVRYNADTGELYTTVNGQRAQTVAHVSDLVGIIAANGGADPGNGNAWRAIGAHLKEKVRAAHG